MVKNQLALCPPLAEPQEENLPVILDPAMQSIFGTLERLATTPLPVLLLGETGCGKEVMAEFLHARSRRPRERMVRLNCACFTEELLESALFGHEKGAFTGALSARPGVVQAAHGGTLFLDEIGELSAAAQAKLLRFLESGEFTPVGSTQSRRVDVRIVAATHRNLLALARSGGFREDLYFRLNGATIAIPPLRERRSEIAPLARMFLRRAARRMDRPEPVIDAALEAALESYAWPGNIRELRNCMDRAVAMGTGAPLTLADLAFDGVLSRAEPTPACRAVEAVSAHTEDVQAGSVRDQIRAFERDRILAALRETGGNRTHAARLLGVSRRTLSNKLNTHEIERGAPRGH
jgi:two-component system, NtrC family, response regulator AtoC